MLQLVSEQVGPSGQVVESELSNVVYPLVRDMCVEHCQCFLLLILCRIGWKLSGGEALLLKSVGGDIMVQYSTVGGSASIVEVLLFL